MAGELNINDEGFANELLALPLPMAFIDFEAFMPQIPGVIPGTMPNDRIPCQWSSHTIFEHGVNAANNIRHGEYLWMGDVGWNPIYSFVQTLYEETMDANTILIYTDYEIQCLKACKQLAENDMERWRANELLMNYYTFTDSGEKVPLASMYDFIIDWLQEQDYEFVVCDSVGNMMEIRDILDEVDEWYSKSPLPYDYLVVDGSMNKVPLMDIAPMIAGWCDSILSRFYDLCYGHVINGVEQRDGGVEYWLQSPEFHHSNSIKYIMPAAMSEYSCSAELLISQGLPANGYDGLRAMGNIAKGDECTSLYLQALNRPTRPGVELSEPGFAPFDMNLANQCLIYCCLDTLSMVVIYLAVMEATDTWREYANGTFAEFAEFYDDGLLHFIDVDTDRGVIYKGCDTGRTTPYSMGVDVGLLTEASLQNMPVRDMYAKICPECRRLRNMYA